MNVFRFNGISRNSRNLTVCPVTVLNHSAFTERKLTEQRVGDDRDYLHGKQDIHEQSMDLQRAVRQVYIDASGYDDDMHVVDCTTPNGEMASPDEIFGRIMQVVESYVKLSK